MCARGLPPHTGASPIVAAHVSVGFNAAAHAPAELERAASSNQGSCPVGDAAQPPARDEGRGCASHPTVTGTWYARVSRCL